MSRLFLLPCLALSTTAMAHTGGEAHGFVAGALHPMAGLDHLLAMLAVGLLAGRCAGHMRWWMPATFVAAMAVGAVLGANSVSVPLIEVGIACSLIAFGSALLSQRPLRAPALVLTAGFALFHGHAHGSEMGADFSAVPYALGFLLATALLHAVGLLLATQSFRPVPQGALLKWSGSAVAAVGIVSLGVLLSAS